jgi:hypothetical protein
VTTVYASTRRLGSPRHTAAMVSAGWRMARPSLPATAVLSPAELKPRDCDEKFHILEAPALFLPDLGRIEATASGV